MKKQPLRLRNSAGNSGGSGSRPVSRVLSWAAIHLGYTSPCTSSDLPGSPCGPHAADRIRLLPYLVLLRVGFTLPPVLPPARCALTAPFHPYPPLASSAGRYLFCGTFRRLTPPRCYLAPCPVEPGLSSLAGLPRERLPGRLPMPVYYKAAPIGVRAPSRLPLVV
jgi:hypothetical protein